jgi:hypothetical protein
MDPTLTAAVIGLVGGFVIWLLNWLWTLYTECRARNRVRTMISIEVAENLNRLRHFWDTARGRAQFPEGSIQAEIGVGDALATIPLPPWSHRMWESLTALIPSALREDEITNIHLVHTQLDNLTKLQGIDRESRSGWAVAFKQIVKELIEKGNPIG